MNKIIRYFDLASELRAKAPVAKAKGKTLHWFPQYVFLIIGIIVQPFFAAYQQTGQWNFAGFRGKVLFAVIVGLTVFPAVYKSSFDPEKPIFVQLCAIFAVGMGWESLLHTTLKATGV
jgi:hypothetical protein